MDQEPQNNAAPTEPGAAQPEATGTNPAPVEQSAPGKSAAEVKLEGQLKAAQTKGEGYKKERDTARTQLTAVSKERDELRAENEQLKAQTSTVATAEPEASAPAQEPSQEEYIKDVLRRNGLTKAYMLPTGPVFTEKDARELAGAEFDSLTVISVD